ncbi:MAG: MBL fold metallo-hydrolase [Acidimicrobiales bacterium]
MERSTILITKFEHACVRIDNGQHRLLIDPGLISSNLDIFSEVNNVLITHEHWDHFDAKQLQSAIEANQSLTIYTCKGVARHLEELGDRVRIVSNGDEFLVSTFMVKAIGENHHISHPDFPPVDNVGFLIDDKVFHPGDALTVVEVPTLLVPVQAPWMTATDLILYLRKTNSQQTFAIHDGLVNHWGQRVIDTILKSEAERDNRQLRRLRVGETVEV